MDGFNVKRMFLSDDWLVSDALQLYTDVTSTKGFSAVVETQWLMHVWYKDLQIIDINILELYLYILGLTIP